MDVFIARVDLEGLPEVTIAVALVVVTAGLRDDGGNGSDEDLA